MDSDTLKAGLLMEAAEAHQQLAGAALKRLDAATRGLEPAVRDAVEQAVAAAVRAELAQVRTEAYQAARALGAVRGQMGWNHGLVAAAVAVLAAATAVGSMHLLGWLEVQRVPVSTSALRANAATLAEFERRRVRVDVGLCGDNRQPCVRVDPKSQTYGQGRDNYLLLPAK